MIDARLGSSLFIFFESFGPLTIFGSGVGSIHELGEDRLSSEFWHNLKLVSQGTPNLKTLMGSVIFDFGLLAGIGIFIFVGYIVLFRLKKEAIKRFIISGLATYSFFGFSYINPIFWFWVFTLTFVNFESLKNKSKSL